MKGRNLLSLAIIFTVATTCCTTVAIFKSDSKFVAAPNGRMLLEDTQDLWEEFTGIVDRDIQRELAGKRAPGGGNWNERWQGSIKSLQKGNRENYEKYVEYIVYQRKRHGLPDL